MDKWTEWQQILTENPAVNDPLYELTELLLTVQKRETDNLLAERLRLREYVLSSQETLQMDDFVQARLQGVPLQYLTGKAWFYGRKFCVGEGVLIPRADTEVLVEHTLKYVKKGMRIADFCTGSGCIGLTLAAEADVFVTLFDLSDDALRYAEQNRKLHDPELKTEVCKVDLLHSIPQSEYDIIVSNPPYIRRDELPELQAEVRKEPQMALDGGEDGLVFYRRIAELGKRCLRKDGYLILECGIGQSGEILQLLRTCGYRNAEVVFDYHGVDRVVSAVR